MRLKQQISACLVTASLVAVAGLFASGRPVSASEQTPRTDARQRRRNSRQLAQPASATRLTADEAVRLALENNLGIQAERLGPQIGTLGVAQARARVHAEPVLDDHDARTAPSRRQLPAGAATSSATRASGPTPGLQQKVPWGGGLSVALDASRQTTNAFTSFNPQLGSNFARPTRSRCCATSGSTRFRQQVLISRKNQEIADLQLREQLTTTSRACATPTTTSSARSGLEVARSRSSSRGSRCKNNQTRVEVGTMAPIDIIEAQAEVAQRRGGGHHRRGADQDGEDILRTLILNPSQPDFWTARLEPAGSADADARSTIDVDAAIKNALDQPHRPRAAAASSSRTRHRHRQFAQNQKLPGVDLVAPTTTLIGVGRHAVRCSTDAQAFPPPILGQSQRSFGDALRDVFGNDFKTWSCSCRSAIRSARAGRRGARRARLQRQQEHERPARTSSCRSRRRCATPARQVTTNLKRVEATRKAREFAERRLEAEQKRMTVGLSTTFQLFQAQRDLARQRAERAERDHRLQPRAGELRGRPGRARSAEAVAKLTRDWGSGPEGWELSALSPESQSESRVPRSPHYTPAA